MHSKQNYTEFIKSELIQYGIEDKSIDAMSEALNNSISIDNYKHEPELTVLGKKYSLKDGIKAYVVKQLTSTINVADSSKSEVEKLVDKYDKVSWYDIPITVKNKLIKQDPYLYKQLKDRCK